MLRPRPADALETRPFPARVTVPNSAALDQFGGLGPQLKSEAVVDISFIPIPSPQKNSRPHPIPVSFNPITTHPRWLQPHPHEIHPHPR